MIIGCSGHIHFISIQINNSSSIINYASPILSITDSEIVLSVILRRITEPTKERAISSGVPRI